MKQFAGTFCNRIKQYWKSHIWSGPVTFSVLFIVFAVSLMLYYFKQEYIQYLKDETYNSEQMTLISASRNLNFIMDDFISVGSDLAIRPEFLSAVQGYQSAGEEDRALPQKELNDLLTSYARSNKWIYDLAIVASDGLVFEYDKVRSNKGSMWGNQSQQMLLELYEGVAGRIEGRSIPQYHVAEDFFEHPNISDTWMFSIAFPLKGSDVSSDLEYVVVMSINAQSLSEAFEFISHDRKDIIKTYLSSDEGRIIYHTGKEYIGRKNSAYLEEGKLEHISQQIERAGWNLNISIDAVRMSEQIDQIYWNGIRIFAIIICVLVLIMIICLRLIIKPIFYIRDSIDKVKRGNFNEQIEIQGYHEIWQLAEEYNKMLIAIDAMTMAVEQGHQEKLLSIRKQQEAEREALESQINSHFICNTLGVINYEVIETGNYKASTLIKKLSNILRYTFDQRHQNVYMCQELSWIEQYLFLQKSRLEEAFDYEIRVDEGFDDWPCRKLMLQPFVENSILHGFEGRESGGFISITGSLVGDRLELVISDNGVGMAPETEQVVRQILTEPAKRHDERVGIGISNVITRMRMCYGSRFEAFVETGQNSGTTFRFLIPRIEKQEEHNENYDS